MANERSLGVAQALLWITGLLTLAYWLAYLGGFRFSAGVECSNELQRGQVPSNAWIILCCFLGAIGLRKQRRWGLFMTIAAASAGLYIGLFDITFNVRAETYSRLPWGELAPELFANASGTLLPAYLFSVVLRAPAWK